MKRIHCIEWSGSLLKHGREKQYGLGQVQVHLPRNKHNKVRQQGEKIYSGLWLRPHAWPDNKLDGELLGCKRLKRQVLMSYINEEHWVALQRWYYIWLTFFFGWYCNGVQVGFPQWKKGVWQQWNNYRAPSVKCIKGPKAQGSSLYLTKRLQNPSC